MFDKLWAELSLVVLPAFGINAIIWFFKAFIKGNKRKYICRALVLLLGLLLGLTGTAVGEFSLYEGLLRGIGFAGVALAFYHMDAFVKFVKNAGERLRKETIEGGK